MEQNETIQKFLPPRAIDSITSGVNRIEKQPYLLLFPVLYDLILWLGPNLSIQQVVMRLYTAFLANAESLYQLADVDVQPLYDLQEMFSNFLSSYNLLSLFQTFPIGIPGLLANADTSNSPIGTSDIYTISSLGSIIPIAILIMFFGFIFGVIFLRTIAPKPENQNSISFFQQVANSFVYSIILLVVLCIGLITILFVSSFFAIFLPFLGQFLLLILLSAMFFFLLPALYAFVPIFLYGQSFYQAVITSYKVVGLRLRFKIDEENSILISPKIIPFSMFILVMYQGLNIIWSLPATDSWWILIGIIGHSFVATLILHACFDFFQKMCDWHHRITLDEVC